MPGSSGLPWEERPPAAPPPATEADEAEVEAAMMRELYPPLEECERQLYPPLHELYRELRKPTPPPPEHDD